MDTTQLDEEIARELQKQFDEEYRQELEEAQFPEGISENVIKFLDDLWNNRNFNIIDSVLATDCVGKSPWGQTVGRGEFKTKLALPLLNAFPDLKYVSHEVFQEGRRIVNRWTFSGTHSGEFEGLPPKGKKISFSGVTINRFNEEGLLAEIHTYFDRMAIIESIEKENKS